MAILKFEPNTPEKIQLKFASGKPHGNQVMYSLSDGRVMFVSQYVDKQLQALQVRPGHRVEITKGIEDGKVRWKVERIAEPKPAAWAQTNGSNGHAQPAAELLESADSLDNPVETYAERNLEQALRISLMAAKKAEEYGQSIGKPIQFDKNDVRAMAATLLINGRGRAA